MSFGELGKLTKQLKQNHALAQELWASGNADARHLALMIADPNKASKGEIIEWMHDTHNTLKADMLARFIQKRPYAQELANQCLTANDNGTDTGNDNEYYQVTGWEIIVMLALNDTILPDAYFENHLAPIQSELQTSKNRTKYAMNKALIAIGSRNLALKAQAQTIARQIGKVIVDHGQTSCKTPDAYEYIEKVWAKRMVKP